MDGDDGDTGAIGEPGARGSDVGICSSAGCLVSPDWRISAPVDWMQSMSRLLGVANELNQGCWSIDGHEAVDLLIGLKLLVYRLA